MPTADDERGALAAAIAALEDMAMVLDGWDLAQIGVAPEDPGAAGRLRRAARILDVMRERTHPRDLSSGPSWWSPN